MANEYVDEGVPVLRGINVNRGRFHDDDFVFISNEKADALHKYEAGPGDVILVHKGTVGPIGIIPETPRFQRYVLGNSMLRARMNPSVLRPEYLYYWLASPTGQHELLSSISQVGVPQIQQPLSTLRRIALPVPDLATQDAICEVLDALERAAEMRAAMNQTLEDIARATFKSWFIDFDPVHAKSNGEPTGLPPEIDTLFPSGFEETEEGMVPEGWEIVPIEDICTISGGSTPSTKVEEYWDGGTHCWATPKDLSSLTTPVLLDTARHITDAGLAKISSGFLSPGTILLSSRAPIGYLAVAQVPTAVNQGFIAMQPNDGISNLYLLRWTEASMERIKNNANGSTFQEISKKNFRPITVVKPTPDVMAAFDGIVRPLFERVVLNEQQSETLAQLRDTLLPRLVSGELQIPVEVTA